MAVLRKHRVWLAGGALLAFILMGWSWAYASPPGSAASDRVTLAAIWCAFGDSESCLIDDAVEQAQVPTWVAGSGCFASDRDVDARCAYLLSAELATIPLDGAMQAPTVFHQTMRLFVGPDPARSIVLMRFFNVALAGALIALAAMVARPVIGRALLLAWATVLAPVGLFFIASTSPQGWVIAGVGTFWAFVTTMLQGGIRRWQTLAAVFGAVLSGGMALTANPDAGFLLAVSLVVSLLLAWPRLKERLAIRNHRLGLAAVASTVALSAVLLTAFTWVSRAGWGADREPLIFPPGDAGRDQPNAILKAVLELPSFVAALVGAQPPVWAQRMSPLDVGIPGYTWPGFTFGLGHTEHLLPSLVGVFLVAAVGAVVLSGLVSYSWRKVVALVLIVVAFVTAVLIRRSLVAFEVLVDPLLPQEFWPYLFLFVAVCIVVFPSRRRVWSVTQISILVGLLAIAQSVALRGTLARYMYGQTHSYTNLSDPLRWWWPSGPEPNQVWFLGTVSGLLLYGLVLAGWTRARAKRCSADGSYNSNSARRDRSAGTSSHRSLVSEV